MPTGYTAKLIDEGQTFEQFVWGCARAMGAFIMMRDDPMDAPIPEKFEPSDYYTNSVPKAQKRLAELLALTNEQKIAEGERLRSEDLKQNEQYLAKATLENQRLDGMAAQVSAWDPPSRDHDGFKEFMLEQLRISKNSTDYMTKAIQLAKARSPLDYFAGAVADAERSIKYGQDELAKELERTEGRNDWIKRLRESVPPASKARNDSSVATKE